MGEQCLDSPIREQHLHPPHAPRRWVALLRGREILTNFSGQAGERCHGAKNGVLM
jgi:hypothetical protein